MDTIEFVEEIILDGGLEIEFNQVEKDEYGLETIPVLKKKTYTQAHRKAQANYRKKNPEKFCEFQRTLYEKNSQNEEWKQKFNERSKNNNKVYREKKREKDLLEGRVFKARGRPKKVEPIEMAESILEEPVITIKEDEEIKKVVVVKSKGRPRKKIEENKEVEISNFCY